MALDFPSSPTMGQLFNGYTWNGTGWVVAADDYAKIDMSNVAPFWDMNLIDNADFIIAHRGVQFTIGTSSVVDGSMALDRWHINGTTGARLTSSGNFGRMTMERASSTGLVGMYQFMETARWLNGYNSARTRDFLVQANVQSVSSPGDLTIVVYTSTAEGSVAGAVSRGSVVTTGASATTMKTVSFLVTLPAGLSATNGMYIYFSFTAGSTAQKWIIENVVMRPVLGGNLSPILWVPRPAAIDLMMCQRFYETGESNILNNANASGWYAGERVRFKVPKRSTPIIALTTISSANVGGRTADRIGTDGFRVQCQSTVLTGLMEANDTWTASAEL